MDLRKSSPQRIARIGRGLRDRLNIANTALGLTMVALESGCNVETRVVTITVGARLGDKSVVPSQRDAMVFERRRSMRFASPRTARYNARNNRPYMLNRKAVGDKRYARTMNARNKARENMRKYKSPMTYKRATSQYKKGKISKEALMKHKDYKGYAWNMIKRLK